jgi:hypothetical protein
MSRSYIDAAPDSDTSADDDALAQFHDETLFEFTRCAEELSRMGHTAGSLARLVERHLTPATVPYPESSWEFGDPIPVPGEERAA